jgi:hypothetical protein
MEPTAPAGETQDSSPRESVLTQQPANRQGSNSPWAVWILALLYALTMLVVGKTRPNSWLDASLLDAAYNMVHSHSLSLEETPFPTGDRARIGGKMCAARMPLAQIAAAGVYFPLHHLFGLGLGGDPSHTAIVYRSMAFAMSVLPAVGCIILVRRLALRWGLPAGRSLAAAALTGFCTLVFPFGAVVGYHIASAFLLLAGLSLLGGNRDDANGRRWHLLAAGLVIGLIPSIDPLTGPVIGSALLLGIVVRQRRAAIPFLAGLGLAAALHVGLNLLFTGRPLPFYVYSDFLEYPGSPFPGGTRHHYLKALPISFYVWRGTLGGTGFFSLSPVAFALALTSVRWWKRRLPPTAFTIYLAGACVICFLLFLVVFPGGGGWSFGPRHLIPWYPMIVLWGMIRLGGPLTPRAKRFLIALAVVSFCLVAPGVLAPYSFEGYRTDSRALIPAQASFTVIQRHLSPTP